MSDLRNPYEATSRLKLEKKYSLDGTGIPTGQTKQDYQIIIQEHQQHIKEEILLTARYLHNDN